MASTPTPTPTPTGQPGDLNLGGSSSSTQYDPFDLDQAFYGSSVLLQHAPPFVNPHPGPTPGMGNLTHAPGKPSAFSAGDDITESAGSIFTSLAASPDALKAIQLSLAAAGLLAYDKYTPGAMDKATRAALEEAIRETQASGKTLSDYLGDRAQSFFSAQKAIQARKDSHAIESMAENDYRSQLASTYVNLWGVAPPPNYLEKIAAAGMNLFEFEVHERNKPGFVKSPRFKIEQNDLQSSLAEKFGFLGGAGVAGSF